MEIVIRDAVRNDADQIAGLHIASWGAGYRHIFPDSVLDDPAFHAERYTIWRGWTHSLTPDRRMRVATLDDRVVGFAHTGDSDDPDSDAAAPVGELFGFYAHPDAWGTGAAAAMMDAALDHLCGLGHVRAVVWTLRDAHRARAFYAKSGWTESGRTDTWDRFADHPVPEVEYEIDLTVLAPRGV